MDKNLLAKLLLLKASRSELVLAKETDKKIKEISKEFLDKLGSIELKHGKDGHTPTEQELIELITPLIPEPIKGDTPSDEQILKLIDSLLPEVKDGYTPIKGKDYFDGKDYHLTEEDKQDIANAIVVEVPELKERTADEILDIISGKIEISDIKGLEEKLKNSFNGKIVAGGGKTWYLKDLKDVNLSNVDIVDGKYVLGSGNLKSGDNVSELVNDAGYLTSETDSQTLSILNRDVSISNGNTITIPETDISSKLDDVTAGTNITIDKTDPNNPVINSTGGGSGISALVDDTTPQLGGDLDTNDKKILFNDGSQLNDSGVLGRFKGSITRNYTPDGQYTSGTSTNTGYLVVKSPAPIGANYIQYDFTFRVTSQYGSPLVINVSAQQLTNGSFNTLHAYSTSAEASNITVRAVKDASNQPYFVFGDADTSWSRIVATVEKANIGYIYKDLDIFSNEWTVTHTTDISSYTTTETVTNVDLLKANIGTSRVNNAYTLNANEWTTIADLGDISYHGRFLIHRYNQANMEFTVSESYGKETLVINSCVQLTSNSYQGVRVTTNNKLQIKNGTSYTSGHTVILLESDGNITLNNEDGTGSEGVAKSIEFSGTEVGQIHAQGIKATRLNLSNIPTSATGLSTGDVWSDSGTLKIVT